MEKRMIEIDTGKTIRLTRKDGEVTITDDADDDAAQELIESVSDEAAEEAEEELIVDLGEEEAEEDDEELASLSEEEAKAYREAQARKVREIEEQGNALLSQAEELFAAGKREEAQEAYEQAREFLGDTAPVCMGILRCATNDFTAREDLDELRDVLDGLRIVAKEERDPLLAPVSGTIEETLAAIRREKAPVQASVEAKRAARAVRFSKDYKSAKKQLAISGCATLVLFALTILFYCLIYRSVGSTFLVLAIAATVCFAAALVVFLVSTNRFVTAQNRLKMNADNAYSNDGRLLNRLEEEEEFYEILHDLL